MKIQAFDLLAEVAGGNFLQKVNTNDGADEVFQCPFCKMKYSFQSTPRVWLEKNLHAPDCLQLRCMNFIDDELGPEARDNLTGLLTVLKGKEEATQGLVSSLEELRG